MKAAAIDIGTNSIKAVIGEKTCKGVRIIGESVLVTRLGEKVNQSGVINPKSAQRTLEGFERLVRECRELGASRIRAAATSVVRDAGNRRYFLSEAHACTGIAVEPLSGSEEAQLCRLAVVMDPAFAGIDGRLVTIDIGGGSTEITYPGQAFSLDLGAVRLHETHIRSDPPKDSEVAAVEASARETLSELALPPLEAVIVGTGGTVVNASRILRRTPVCEYADVHGESINSAELEELRAQMARMPVDKRRQMVGLDPERADIILTGIIILQAVMAAIGAKQVAVSVRGLRHGMLHEMLEAGK